MKQIKRKIEHFNNEHKFYILETKPKKCLLCLLF